MLDADPIIKSPISGQLLICIYTCVDDDHLLEPFYKSEVVNYLLSLPKVQVIEVRADESLLADTLEGHSLTLSTQEHYNNLPNKTFSMIQFAVRNLEFDYLLKIDVTTLTTVIQQGLLTGGKAIDERELLSLLRDQCFYCDYNGYVVINAKRPGAENWAVKKNINIDYDRVFDSDKLPSFYSGKLWLISHQFAEFVSLRGEVVVSNFSKFFPAEDVMLGKLYKDYKDQKYYAGGHTSRTNFLRNWIDRFLRKK